MKNRSNISLLSAITLTAAGLVCLYYFVYLILCLAGLDSRLMSFFAIFVMSCAALPIIFHDKLKKHLKRAFKPMHIAFTAFLCVYVISVIFFWCYIGFNTETTPAALKEAYSGDAAGEDTVILVFGCRTYGYTPSLTLKHRLNAAHYLLTLLPEAKCIVSGGQGSNETVPEADAMLRYLTERGISEDRIITESKSHSTSENVRFTKALMDDLSMDNKKLIGVSTAFHLPRIKALSSRYDLPMELYASPSPSFGHHYVSMVREYLSYIKMILFDEAVLITKLK